MKNKEKKKRKKARVFLILLGFIGLLVCLVVLYAGKLYIDTKKTVEQVNEPIPIEMRKSTYLSTEDKIKSEQPFSVLILGLDTGDFGRVDVGRSDTVMIATVNPVKKTTYFISIPRDAYTEIIGRNFWDKINHAYAFGGVPMALDTVEMMLQTSIDFYISINMEGLQQAIDELGGVTIQNKTAFKYSRFDYPEGELTLNGIEALQYMRMRAYDPRGDYGRQERQRIVLEAITQKLLTIATITKYNQFLKIIGNNMKTDFNWDDLLAIRKNYSPALKNVQQDFVQGNGAMINGVSYEVIPDIELNRVRSLIKTELEQ